MDEASSKYLDNIVMTKLLEEKLEKVAHKPQVLPDEIEKTVFEDFHKIDRYGDVNKKDNSDDLEMISPIISEHDENRTCSIKVYPAENKKASIVMVHGLYEDNREIYSFLLKELNSKGYDVYLMTLPFHYDRTPASGFFSGEFFWSADVSRTQTAYKQAVYELYQFYNYLERDSVLPVFVAGFSMGGAVTLTLLSFFSEIKALWVMNPPFCLYDVVCDSPLFSTIRNNFIDNGYCDHDIKNVFLPLEPQNAEESLIDTDRICMAYSAYDQVIQNCHYRTFREKWNLSHVVEYKAGHLNMLRVPRLAGDIDTFFKSRITDAN